MRLPSLLTLLLLCFFVPFFVFASGFQLKTVGGLNVDGVTYNKLWYTNGNVTFTGIATSGATVTATIDGTSAAVTADGSGNWSYSTSLTDGDHNVSFTSDAGSKSFTLTIGAVPEGVGGLPAADTPTVGSVNQTIMVIFAGLGLLLLGYGLYTKKLSKT